MTPQQQFKELESLSSPISNVQSVNCEIIADKHAIDFTRWFWDLPNKEEISRELTWKEILNQYYKENL